MTTRLNKTEIELLERGQSFFFKAKKEAILFCGRAYVEGIQTEMFEDELFGIVVCTTEQRFNQVWADIAEFVGDDKIKLLLKLNARLQYGSL